MTPAPAPAPINVQFALGQLMDRTECLPELRNDVATLKSDMRHLRDEFNRHSQATDDAISKISGTATENTNALSYLRGKWQGAVIVVLVLKEIAVHFFFPRPH
jgi:hypothetical protein